MKDNARVIHFHIKSRGVQGFVFVQIAFEKCTTNLYFENGKVAIKTVIPNFFLTKPCIFATFGTFRDKLPEDGLKSSPEKSRKYMV